MGGIVPVDPALVLNLGIGGAFLTMLFVGLARGTIYTAKAVDRIVSLQEKRIEEKDHYIEKLEEINRRVDKRNDLLASKVDQLLEVSRAQGMIQALPPSVSERVVP